MEVAGGPVVALTGSMAQVVSEESWGRRCREASWGLVWWSCLNCGRLGQIMYQRLQIHWFYTSVGDTSVGGKFDFNYSREMYFLPFLTQA